MGEVGERREDEKLDGTSGIRNRATCNAQSSSCSPLTRKMRCGAQLCDYATMRYDDLSWHGHAQNCYFKVAKMPVILIELGSTLHWQDC